MRKSYIYFWKNENLIGLFIFFCIALGLNLHAQDQVMPDTLKTLETVYSKNPATSSQSLKTLFERIQNEPDPEKRLEASEELIRMAKEKDSVLYLCYGVFEHGNAYKLRGDFSKALQNYFEMAKIANSLENNRLLGAADLSIADVYSKMSNHEQAIKYYDKSINTFRKLKDAYSTASALFNLGDAYLKNNELNLAFSHFEESQELFKSINDTMGVAYTMGSMGVIYAMNGENEKAEKNIHNAVQTLEKKEKFDAISEYLTNMSDIYQNKKNIQKATDFALMSREIAETYGFKEQISNADLKLSQLYEDAGDVPTSYKYYKDHIKYRDSINNIASVQKMAGMRADYEVAQKQMEVNLLNEKQKSQKIAVIAVSSAGVLIALLAFGLYRRNRFIKRTNIIIEEERNRSNNLLLNILPEDTAAELKENGHVKAKQFDNVSIMFVDFQKFTLYSERLSPERLIEIVDYYFSAFDEIMDKYGLEKIKTIGDRYMAAGGLPFPSEDHAHKMINAAFDILDFVEAAKENTQITETQFEVRIGINSGSVVAGVVGTKKFAYDIWGDAVNIASRMESSSIAGNINISENTHELVKDDFECKYRGEIEVKNRGILKMYFVTGFKNEAKNVSAENIEQNI